MILASICIVIGLWVLYSGRRFYKEVDWNKSPNINTPDIGAMRKREKELLRIRDLLEEARAEGKISRALLDEFNTFCDEEIAGIRSAVGLTPPSKS